LLQRSDFFLAKAPSLPSAVRPQRNSFSHADEADLIEVASRSGPSAVADAVFFFLDQRKPALFAPEEVYPVRRGGLRGYFFLSPSLPSTVRTQRNSFSQAD
jgi:hypothetical protein